MKSTINNDPYDIDKLVEESEGPEDVGGHLDLFPDEPVEDEDEDKDFDPSEIFAPIAEDNEDEDKQQGKPWMEIDPLWLIAILCFGFVFTLEYYFRHNYG